MQTRLLHALTLLENRIGSYSQGMAFVTAFMLLFLPDARAIAISLRLASDDRYLKGYLFKRARIILARFCASKIQTLLGSFIAVGFGTTSRLPSR